MLINDKCNSNLSHKYYNIKLVDKNNKAKCHKINFNKIIIIINKDNNRMTRIIYKDNNQIKIILVKMNNKVILIKISNIHNNNN